MRRGLLKDLANTPTQMACGWRLYGDLRTLAAAEGSTIEIDLITGLATIDGEPTSHHLHIAAEIHEWLIERVERDQVPPNVIVAATLALTPSVDKRGLEVACSTRLQTSEGVHQSADTARWHGLDVRYCRAAARVCRFSG